MAMPYHLYLKVYLWSSILISELELNILYKHILYATWLQSYPCFLWFLLKFFFFLIKDKELTSLRHYRRIGENLNINKYHNESNASWLIKFLQGVVLFWFRFLLELCQKVAFLYANEASST